MLTFFDFILVGLSLCFWITCLVYSLYVYGLSFKIKAELNKIKESKKNWLHFVTTSQEELAKEKENYIAQKAEKLKNIETLEQKLKTEINLKENNQLKTKLHQLDSVLISYESTFCWRPKFNHIFDTGWYLDTTENLYDFCKEVHWILRDFAKASNTKSLRVQLKFKSGSKQIDHQYAQGTTVNFDFFDNSNIPFYENILKHFLKLRPLGLKCASFYAGVYVSYPKDDLSSQAIDASSKLSSQIQTLLKELEKCPPSSDTIKTFTSTNDSTPTSLD